MWWTIYLKDYMKQTNLNSVQRQVNRNRTKKAIFFGKLLSLTGNYDKEQLKEIKNTIRSVYTEAYCDGAISQITK